jgi:hypothetical protein
MSLSQRFSLPTEGGNLPRSALKSYWLRAGFRFFSAPLNDPPRYA